MNKPKNEKDLTAASVIAAAVRSKHRRRSALAADLEALEASLLADIAAFDLRALTREQSVPAPAATRPATDGTANPYPEIMPEGVARPVALPAVGAGAAPLPPAAANDALPPRGDGIGLLDELRRQAQAQQQDTAARQRRLTELDRQLDAALRRIFKYSLELVEQLDILQPPIARQYSLLGSFDLAGLSWQKGFADYRTRPDSVGALCDQVIFSAHLSASRQLRLEREGPAAERFRQTLFDHGIVFSADEIRNERRQVEKIVFAIAADVRINLRWRAEPERGVLVLESRNLERFGSCDYAMAPEMATAAMLDEFGRLLLGQPNRFRAYLSRA